MVVERTGIALHPARAGTPNEAPDLDEERASSTRSPAARHWSRRLRIVVSIALVGVVAYVAWKRGHDLTAAGSRLASIRWYWVVLAVVLEGASMVVFARLQRWLLRAGGVRVGLGPMIEITLAGNALGTTLPGGVAWSGAWAYGQLRRRGAGRALSVRVLLVAGAVASFALFVLVAAGVQLAGSGGPLRGFRVTATVLAVIPVAVGLSVVACRRWRQLRRPVLEVLEWVEVHLPGGRAVFGWVRLIVGHIEQMDMTPRAWAEVLGLALLKWIEDLGCLVASMLALGVGVPWKAIVVAYAFTQIAASLPITPGGLGVVEGSLVALLVAYGTPLDGALATVILYRIISFWALVPVGWGLWVYIDLVQRRDTRLRRAHPWAFHRHRDRDSGEAPPEQPRPRFPMPAPCEGCGEPVPPERQEARSA